MGRLLAKRRVHREKVGKPSCLRAWVLFCFLFKVVLAAAFGHGLVVASCRNVVAAGSVINVGPAVDIDFQVDLLLLLLTSASGILQLVQLEATAYCGTSRPVAKAAFDAQLAGIEFNEVAEVAVPPRVDGGRSTISRRS
jgi:hypothetical protein